MNPWQRVADGVIPASVGPPGSDARRRAGLAVVLASLVMAVGAAAMAIARSVDAPVQFAIDAALLVAAAGVLVALRLTGSLRLVGNLLAGIVFVTFCALSLLSAGRTVPPFLAFAIVPMLAVLIAGRGSGVFWAVAGCAQLLLLHTLVRSGLEPAVPVTPELLHVSKYVGTAIVIWALFFLTLAYESLNGSALGDLREASARAERASAAKGRFLANMSHEIRTPINGVLGMTELLLDTELSASQREMAGTVLRSAHTLLDVVNDILDFSRIEAGRMELEHAEFALEDVLSVVRDVLRVRAAEKGLEFDVECTGGVPPRVRGDAVRLRQVLLNLVGNAVKFTERGKVTVQVHPAPAPDGRATVGFLVRDTGIGIPEDRIPSLFDEFTQGDASTTRRFGGTGLGLTIAAHLVGLMGGRIEVESRPGAGSTFRFRIPLETVSASAPAPVARATELRSAVAGRVLVVEDQAVNRTVVVRLLEKLGCEVDVASDGAEACAAVAKTAYDLVLMDCEMPVMDGFAATEEIRRIEGGARHVPIVALTANAVVGDRERCLAAGMDDYLAKPIRRERLEALVRRLLG